MPVFFSSANWEPPVKIASFLFDFFTVELQCKLLYLFDLLRLDLWLNEGGTL